MFKLLLIFFTIQYLAFSDICGPVDNRTSSFDSRVGRLNNGCTATMISRSIAISAGHCLSSPVSASAIEFNVFKSKLNGVERKSSLFDTYKIDKSSVALRDLGQAGQDYAIFRLKRNSLTGKLAGEVQGYHQIDFHYIAQPGDVLRITGYGKSTYPTLSWAQKTHHGWLTGSDYKRNILEYRVDTTQGDSGSAIFNANTNLIIGIHTHGGCAKEIEEKSANRGTGLFSLKEFQNVYKEFLRLELY